MEWDQVQRHQKESKATVELVERFVEAGFSIETALDTVNSIMSMKFEEDEKFSTLDLSTIVYIQEKHHL